MGQKPKANLNGGTQSKAIFLNAGRLPGFSQKKNRTFPTSGTLIK
jgi:hypothetical protein